MTKKITSIFIKSVLNRFMRIENLYLKFILTVIAGALIVIATELFDKNPQIKERSAKASHKLTCSSSLLLGGVPNRRGRPKSPPRAFLA